MKGGVKIKSLVFANFKNKFYRDSHLVRLLIMFISIFVLLSIVNPDKFLSINNFQSMAFQFPEFGLLSIAIMLTMITGGIDLSVVGVANLTGIIVAKVLLFGGSKGLPQGQMVLVIILAIIIGIIIGAVCGLINGNLISRIGITPILATLGSMQLFTGAAIIITGGKSISGLPVLYSKIGAGMVFGMIPISLIVFLLAITVVGYLLRRTRYGLSIYMMGSNPLAARFSGLNNKMLLNRTYMYSGILASISGLIMLAYYNSAKADYGSTYTLQCVLIVVLAGVNPVGGAGSVAGLTIAILILQLLSSGLNMFPAVSSFYKPLIWGVVLIIVMVSNYYVHVRTTKSLPKV